VRTLCPQAYLFLCSNLTMKECFDKKLFGITEAHWNDVKQIKPDDILFLFNVNSRALIGPFKATSEGKWKIDPEAWRNASREFPAQVKVSWEKLHIIKKADEKFPFLTDRSICKLTEEQTNQLLNALEKAEEFDITVLPEPQRDIRWESEKMFADLLDRNEIAYIRFSQFPGDFSKILKEMKAKRPDFLVFGEKPIFIEVKPNPLRQGRKDFFILVDEVEKLKQLELATKVTTLIAFPIDVHGLEWRALSPAWIWAKGERKQSDYGEILTIPVKEIENKKLPFL